MFNCSHKAQENLTIDDVNAKSGRWLHNFKWLKESQIEIFHQLGTDKRLFIGKLNPKNVHFTRGSPWFNSLRFKIRKIEKKYFDEWEALRVNKKKNILKIKNLQN